MLFIVVIIFGHIVAVIRCKQSELIAKDKGGSDNAQRKQKEM